MSRRLNRIAPLPLLAQPVARLEVLGIRTAPRRLPGAVPGGMPRRTGIPPRGPSNELECKFLTHP